MLKETCSSSVFGVRFFLPLELRFLLPLLVVARFSGTSWLVVISLAGEGNSGVASGHGVRLAGTVISNGGSIIHLLKTEKMEIFFELR